MLICLQDPAELTPACQHALLDLMAAAPICRRQSHPLDTPAATPLLLPSAPPSAASASDSALSGMSTLPMPIAVPATTLPVNLLKLMVHAPVRDVADKAEAVVRARLKSLLGLEDAHDSEPDIWLWHLPRSPGHDQPSDGANR